MIWLWSRGCITLIEYLTVQSPSRRLTSLLLPNPVVLSYQVQNLWKGLWIVASLSPLYSLWKALEENETTSGRGVVADRWRQSSGSLGSFTDLAPVLNWRKPNLILLLAPPLHTQAQVW